MVFPPRTTSLTPAWDCAYSQLPFPGTHCLAPPAPDRKPHEGRARPPLEPCDGLSAQHRAWNLRTWKLLGEEESEPRAQGGLRAASAGGPTGIRWPLLSCIHCWAGQGDEGEEGSLRSSGGTRLGPDTASH